MAGICISANFTLIIMCFLVIIEDLAEVDILIPSAVSYDSITGNLYFYDW